MHTKCFQQLSVIPDKRIREGYSARPQADTRKAGGMGIEKSMYDYHLSVVVIRSLFSTALCHCVIVIISTVDRTPTPKTSTAKYRSPSPLFRF